MRLEVEGLFVGAGCNRIVHNVSWGIGDLVAFGAQNAVALFFPEVINFLQLAKQSKPFSLLLLLLECAPFLQLAQIVTTLPGHKSVVNCTCWLPSSRDRFKGALFQLFLVLLTSKVEFLVRVCRLVASVYCLVVEQRCGLVFSRICRLVASVYCLVVEQSCGLVFSTSLIGGFQVVGTDFMVLFFLKKETFFFYS